MKKITFIAPGNSIHSQRWINFFNNQNYKLQWISFHEFKESSHLINQIYLKNKFYNLLFNNLKVLTYVKIFKSDIVHIHSASFYLFSSILLFFIKKRILITPWGSDINYAKGLKKILLNFFLKKAHTITTDSYCFYDEFLKLNINTKLINFGIDTNFFKPNLCIEKNIIICPRGFDEIYRPFTILNAINKIKFKIKNLNFVLLGNKDHQIKISNYINDKQIHNIVSISGPLDQKAYLDLLNESKGMISASISDAGISSSIAEFMSCNKIIIAANNSDNKYWIKDKVNGYLFENDDIDELAEILLHIDKNIERIKFINRELILKRNDYVNEMNKVKKIYSNNSI